MKPVLRDLLFLAVVTIVCGGAALQALLRPGALAGLMRLLTFC
jgi:hypothetical protein